MSTNKDKINIICQIKLKLESMRVVAIKSAEDAQIEANYHIGAMQSRYDTFKEEAQYLAEAQKIRILTINENISVCDSLIHRLSSEFVVFDAVELGAVVFIKNERTGHCYRYFIVPEYYGGKNIVDGIEVMCVTDKAPVISPFVGLNEGDYPDVYSDNDMADCFVDKIF